MTTLRTFDHPKDPRVSRWYTIDFGVPLASIGQSGVTIAVSTNPSVPSGPSEWTTPGDVVAGSPLVASQVQLAASGTGVKFWLDAGVPGTHYAVGAEALDAAGNHLFGSLILPVSGQ